MKNVLIASFIVFPSSYSILMGEISFPVMAFNCIFLGIIAFIGFVLMHACSHVFRSSEWLFCWMPFLVWYIIQGVLIWICSGEFEFRILENPPCDIALLCSVAFYMLCYSRVKIRKI